MDTRDGRNEKGIGSDISRRKAKEVRELKE
jgi:hypothetical protein